MKTIRILNHTQKTSWEQVFFKTAGQVRGLVWNQIFNKIRVQPYRHVKNWVRRSRK